MANPNHRHTTVSMSSRPRIAASVALATSSSVTARTPRTRLPLHSAGADYVALAACQVVNIGWNQAARIVDPN